MTLNSTSPNFTTEHRNVEDNASHISETEGWVQLSFKEKNKIATFFQWV